MRPRFPVVSAIGLILASCGGTDRLPFGGSDEGLTGTTTSTPGAGGSGGDAGSSTPAAGRSGGDLGTGGGGTGGGVTGTGGGGTGNAAGGEQASGGAAGAVPAKDCYPPASPETLFPIGDGFAIAAGDGGAYFVRIDAGNLSGLLYASCAGSRDVAVGPSFDAMGVVAITATDIYCQTAMGLLKIPKSGGSPTTLPYGWCLTEDDGATLDCVRPWTNYPTLTPTTIWRLPGGDPSNAVLLLQYDVVGDGVIAMTRRGTKLYFGIEANAAADPQRIERIDVVTGEHDVLPTKPFSVGSHAEWLDLVADDEAVYVLAMKDDGSWGRRVIRIPLDGGDDGVLIDDVNVPPLTVTGDFVLKGDFLYWGGVDGVYRAPKAGGAPVRIAPSTAYIEAIALDERAVYWTTRYGVPVQWTALPETPDPVPASSAPALPIGSAGCAFPGAGGTAVCSECDVYPCDGEDVCTGKDPTHDTTIECVCANGRFQCQSCTAPPLGVPMPTNCGSNGLECATLDATSSYLCIDSKAPCTVVDDCPARSPMCIGTFVQPFSLMACRYGVCTYELDEAMSCPGGCSQGACIPTGSTGGAGGGSG